MNDKVLSIIVKAQDQASKVLDTIGSRAEGMATKIASAAALAAKASGVALAGGILAASKASWDQVSAVQQSTIALSAYEPNATKVSAVLQQLVAYAQSDMGVLFNRKDLFEAAQNLKLYGDNTDELTSHVKIMSKSVGLGLSTWDGLNNVIGRVGSTGKLYADDLQYLQNAGFKLDGSLSGTTQTFDSLFSLLDKGIPTDALRGQANTIEGIGIRFQTAFRGVGNAILGVDSTTNQFIAGGLGDKLTQGLKKVTDALKSPAAKTFFTDIGNGLTTIASASGTVLSTLATQASGWSTSLQSIADVVTQHLSQPLSDLWTTISQNLVPAIDSFWHTYLEPLAPFLAGAFLLAVQGIVTGFGDLLTGVSGVLDFMDKHTWVVYALATAFGTMATSMALGAAFDAIKVGIATLQLVTLPSLVASIGTIATTWAAAFPVAGILVDIGLVYKAIKSVLDAFDDMSARDSSARNEANQRSMAISNLENLVKNGNPTQQAASRRSLRTLGVPGYATGGYTGYGAADEVAGVVHKGEYVIPKSGVDQSTGLPAGMGSTTFNMYGNITLGSSDAVSEFFGRLNAQKEMGNLGVGI